MLTLDHSNNSFFLLGDYNIDLSKQNIEPKVRNYINEVYSSGCCSLINKPTRITSISSTILDHVYTNSSEKVCASGILVLDVSDHLPTFCTIQNNFYKPCKLKEQVHDMKHFNAESYCEDVSYRLKKLKQLSDPSTKMSKFLDVIASATNDHAPLRLLSRKEMKIKSKPWLTKGLLKSISTKNALFQKCYKQNKIHLITHYKIYLNKLTKLKRIAKKNYYQKEIHKQDESKQWKIINEILGHKKNKHKIVSTITDVNNRIVSENTEICNIFNNYFTNVGPSMDAKIPNTQVKKFSTTNVMKSFCYDPISPEEVLLQLQQLGTSKASGPENIPNKFYKLLAPIISPFLSEIFNGCYKKGDFPFILKHAKVIPIHKSGHKDIVSNYRPISILSTVSKIFEKLLYFRLESFFTTHKLITQQQFGFRQGYSTEMAITDLQNMLQNILDDGYFTCCIFLDLSKAFDTVNHRILLDKLYSYGIRGNMHKLLTSYLQNRKQFTVCNNIKSQINTIVCGVPQGSTLGPLLFSLYVNDLPLHTKFHVNLFADDTVLILKNKNHINLQALADHELTIINDWMKYNRLSLNYKKSVYFISAPKQKRVALQNFQLHVGGHKLSNTDCVKYLGVFINNKITWKEQVYHVVNKLANAARILSKMRHYVNKKTLVKLYYSFAYSHLKYGILAWGTAANNLLQKVQVVQNRIIRIMEFKSLADCVTMNTLYKSLNILRLKDIFELEIAKFMHSFHHNKIPENFNSYFRTASQQHTHLTRSITNKNYFLKRVNTKYGQSSFNFHGVKIWNKIPLLNKSLSWHSFTKYYSSLLLKQY